MKKSFLIVCIALLLALACVACIACDPVADDDGNKDGLNDYETATYTVTFNANSSDFKMENSVINNVPAGSTIAEPCYSNGDPIKPYKTGYTFLYWSTDGTNPFNFATDTINAPTTLTALYKNNVYSHELGKNFYIDKKLDITKNIDGTLSYEIVDSDNGASMSADNKTLDLTYSATCNLAYPNAKDGDKFLFWFYMKDGKPVQFTKIKTGSESTVATLEKYSKAGYLDIYAMFESTLPKVDVVFDEADTTLSIPANGTVSASDVPTISKGGYKFKNWYYVVTKEVDGESVSEEVDFTFTTDDSTGTSLYSACSLANYFTPATLTLYPRWTKQISIASAKDYKDIYDVLHKDEPTESDLKEIKEILSADIYISDIDFAGETLEPLFDADHVFTGTIDGGTYSDDEVTKCASIKNITIENSTQLSLFGYVSGQVKNINVEITLRPQAVEGKYANKILVGGIATQNGGSIENCDVTVNVNASDADNALQALIVGGIVAINNGSSSVKNTGFISSCNVELTLANCNSESLILGGVVAQGNSASAISSCTVKSLKIENSKCASDGNASNGSSFAKVGGIMASNGGQISSCAVIDLAVELESRDEMYFGGICADNSGSISKSYVNAETVSLKVGGGVSPSVCIGGLIGTNEGYIINSYCNANISVSANRNNAIISLGGIAGNNISAKTDSTSSTTTGIGAINYVYATGSIKLNVENDVSVSTYVGGIIGRNSATKISNCFTLVDIDVVNGKDSTNHIGNLLGSKEKDGVLGSGLVYATDNKLNLNGNSAESSTTVGNDNIKPTKASFLDGNKNYETMQLKFDFDNVWYLGEGALPTLR